MNIEIKINDEFKRLQESRGNKPITWKTAIWFENRLESYCYNKLGYYNQGIEKYIEELVHTIYKEEF